MELKVSTEAPFIPVVLSAATGNPSLYHVSTGRGTPDASQLILILLPAETYIWRGWFTVNLGGDGSKIKTHKRNQVKQYSTLTFLIIDNNCLNSFDSSLFFEHVNAFYQLE